MQSPMEVGGKRLREPPAEGQSDGKKIRTGLPSLAGTNQQPPLAQPLSHLFSELELMIRHAVREEVENKINGATLLPRLLPMQIQPKTETPKFRLSFSKPISTPIFTQINIEDEEGAPLQISLERVPEEGTWGGPVSSPASVRVELVVLDGQFSADEWTKEEFERSVVKERTGRRPLIVGDTSVTVKDGGPTAIHALMFTDNSCWIRSRRFRIGARAAAGSCRGLRIEEAVTEAFIVKDHRGHLHQKHHPPRLDDEVWRLEKIGKDGKFHERLDKSDVNTVQDFLKLLSVQPNRLKQTLGMPEKTWERAVAHANTCPKGTKRYILRKPNGAIFAFDSACQLVAVVSDGHARSSCNLSGEIKERIDQMKWEAYTQWDSLQVIEDSELNNFAIQRGLVLPQVNAGGPSTRFQANNQDVVATTSYQMMVVDQVESFDWNVEDLDSWNLLNQFN